jgi:hypothetical protein
LGLVNYYQANGLVFMSIREPGIGVRNIIKGEHNG